MEKLSIEEKARRYDESLEKARKLKDEYNDIEGYYPNQWLCEELFPELKESEDERIRKALIEMVHDTTGDELWVDYGIHKEEALAWLEKQQKSADKSKIRPKFKTGDRVIGIVSGMQYFITKVCDNHYNTESGCIIMFCAQDNFELYEQKPSDKVEQDSSWSEEDETTLNGILSCIKHCQDEDTEAQYNGNRYVNPKRYESMSDWLKSLKDRVQPKQECSEEDKKILDGVITNYESGYLPSVEKRDEIIEKLESLKNRVHPQPRQEWSEEDEYMIDFISKRLFSIGAASSSSEIDWLKSLKDRYTWKPSDEQMNALSKAIAFVFDSNSDVKHSLESLYNELKKL